MMVGSPAYMAPEIINGEDATDASDLWSLGVLLYEMLAGKAPFTGQGIANVLYQITHAPIPPISGASPAVQGVLARALDRDPTRRYPSAYALAEAFRLATAPRQPRAGTAAMARLARHSSIRAPWILALLLLAAMVGGALLRSHRSPPQIVTKTAAQRPKMAAHVPVRPTLPAPPPVIHVAAVRQEHRQPALRRHHRRHVALSTAAAHPTHVTPLGVSHKAAFRFVPHGYRSSYRAAFLAPKTHRAFRHPIAARTEQSLPRSSRPETPSPGLLGTWHGTNSRNPATLNITRSHAGGFDGIMTVKTHEALVRVAVTGRVSGGHVRMRETRVLSQSRPRAWDLGGEFGELGSSGRMGGTESDVKGRSGRWSFSR